MSRIRATPTRLEQVIFTFATIHGTGVLSSILIKIEGRTGLLRAGDGESSCFSCLEPIAAVAANPGALGFPTAAHCTSILGGAQVEAAWPRRCRNSAQGTSKSPRGCARHQAPGGQNGDCFRLSSEGRPMPTPCGGDHRSRRPRDCRLTEARGGVRGQGVAIEAGVADEPEGLHWRQI